MSLQKIIDRATAIEFDRRRIVGQSISRSQRIKTAERMTAQPWTFVITPPGMLVYSDSRSDLENIYRKDRSEESEIRLANNPGLDYITAYRGDLTVPEQSTLMITATTTQTLMMTVSGSVSSSTRIFQAGDFVQPQGSRYPYAVTEDVYRGTGTNFSVPLNRPIITSENTTITGSVLVGSSVSFRVVVLELPKYRLVNRDRVQFTGDFRVVEKVI